MSRAQLEKVWLLLPAFLLFGLVVIIMFLSAHFDLMTDKDRIERLIQEASSIDRLQVLQARAAGKLLNYDGEKYPEDGCAITLSLLLQNAGIDVPDVFTAVELGKTLRERGWQTIAPGRQEAGDIGSTCCSAPRHGFDHIYLVVQKLDDDDMIVVDNQLPIPHFRHVGGEDKTPTRFFLRPSNQPPPLPVPGAGLERCASALFGGPGLLQSSPLRLWTADSSLVCH